MSPLETKLRKLLPNASEATIRRTIADRRNQIDGLAPDTERQQNPRDESMGSPARADINPGRRLVRITSFRVRLIDERNLFDKYFTDALVRAGFLFDDSPKFCKVEVHQTQVNARALERTEITITEL